MMTTDTPTPPSLTIAALELPARFGDVETQFARTDALLSTLTDVDLAVLPETSLTGYLSPSGDSDLRPFSEPLDGPTVRALGNLAMKHRTAIVGPLVERVGDRYFNSMILLDAHGALVGHWRKRHPWEPETWATPGNLGTPVVTLQGVKVTAAICYDLHFIRADAPEALRTADVFLFPSAWVQGPSTRDERTALLSSLAQGEGLWVVNANWGLGRPAVHGQGGSMAINPKGTVVARTPRTRSPSAITVRVQARSPTLARST